MSFLSQPGFASDTKCSVLLSKSDVALSSEYIFVVEKYLDARALLENNRIMGFLTLSLIHQIENNLAQKEIEIINIYGKEIFNQTVNIILTERSKDLVAFTPTSKTIETNSEKNLYTFEFDKETITGKGSINFLNFNPSGNRIITVTNDNTPDVWHIEVDNNLRFLYSLDGHKNSVIYTAFSPDEKNIVTTSLDRSIRVWHSETGSEINKLEIESKGWLTSADQIPNSEFLASSYSYGIIQVRHKKTNKHRFLPIMAHNKDYITSIQASPNGKYLVSASDDRTVSIWSAKTGKHINTLRHHTKKVSGALFSPNSQKVLSYSADGTASLWNPFEKDSIPEPLSGHTAPIISASFSNNGTIVITTAEDYKTKIWDAATGENIGTIDHLETPLRAYISPDNTWVLTLAGKIAKLWDVKTRSEILVIDRVDARYSSAGFSPDGERIALATSEGRIRILKKTLLTELVRNE